MRYENGLPFREALFISTKCKRFVEKGGKGDGETAGGTDWIRSPRRFAPPPFIQRGAKGTGETAGGTDWIRSPRRFAPPPFIQRGAKGTGDGSPRRQSRLGMTIPQSRLRRDSPLYTRGPRSFLHKGAEILRCAQDDTAYHYNIYNNSAGSFRCPRVCVAIQGSVCVTRSAPGAPSWVGCRRRRRRPRP